jgi:D-psicose/D-tagatose/L-ribulose 3-epimerase
VPRPRVVRAGSFSAGIDEEDEMNPIGVNAWVWVSPLTDERLEALAPHVRELGFDVLELPVEQVGDWDPGRAAEVLAANGLRASVCLVMPPGRELAAASPDVVAETKHYLCDVIDAAAAVGASTVGGPAYTSVGRLWRMDADERRRLYAELREALRPVADHAGRRGVRLAVEPLVRYETSVVNTVDQALELLDGLPAESVGILFDTYHANVEEQGVAEALRRAGPRLAALHACGNDRGAPAAGDNLDWPAIVAAAAEVGYDGPVVIESFTAENATIATAASIWRPLAPTQDALAVDGRTFLAAAFAR